MDALDIFTAPLDDRPDEELVSAENALCYRFSAVPSESCSRFFDHGFKHGSLDASTILQSQFESAEIEGLLGSIHCVPGAVTKPERS